MSLIALRQRIRELGGPKAGAVVSLELFFDGNDDEGSIGCNLSSHPGLATFHRTLHAIRARSDVSDVVVQIVDAADPTTWPFSDRVYVITTATDEAVHAWAVALRPDPPSADRYKEWFGEASPPPGAPAVPVGHRVTYLFWD